MTIDRRQLITAATASALGLATASFGGPQRSNATTTTPKDPDAPAAPKNEPPAVSEVDFLGVPVVTRAGWGADESIMDFKPIVFSDAQVLTVHHSALAVDADPSESVRWIYQFHAVERGWGDIGYQLLIAPDGTVFAGRSTGDNASPVFNPTSGPLGRRSVTGAHSGGFNTGNIGICMLGDFTSAQPEPAAREALVTVLAALCRTLELDPQGTVTFVNEAQPEGRETPAIARHRDWNSTECPGNAFAPTIDEVRADVASRMTPIS